MKNIIIDTWAAISALGDSAAEGASDLLKSEEAALAMLAMLYLTAGLLIGLLLVQTC